VGPLHRWCLRRWWRGLLLLRWWWRWELLLLLGWWRWWSLTLLWWRLALLCRQRWWWSRLLGRPLHLLWPPLRLLALWRRWQSLGATLPPPPTLPSSGAWGPAPPQRIHRHSGTFTTYPPRGPDCSVRRPPPAPPFPCGSGRSARCSCGGTPAPPPSRRELGLRRMTRQGFGWRAAGCRARCQGSGSRELGSPPTHRITRTPSSSVGNDARTAVRIAWSPHRALIPLESTNDSRAYTLPVIARIRTSNSVQDRSEPAPRIILLQSFTLMNMQAILDCCCRGAMRHLRKSPSTIMDVRLHLARVLTRSSTGSSFAGMDGLAFQQLRSRRGPSVDSSRWSLASVMVMTQSLHRSSHLALEKALM
jgi:hypothetical protein